MGAYDQLFEVAENYQILIIAACLEGRRGQLPMQALLSMKVMGLEAMAGHHLDTSGNGACPVFRVCSG